MGLEMVQGNASEADHENAGDESVQLEAAFDGRQTGIDKSEKSIKPPEYRDVYCRFAFGCADSLNRVGRKPS